MIAKLTGQTIVVTRDREQAGSFIRQIERHGGKPILFPTIRIEPPSAWSAFDMGISMLKPGDWVVFTSANAVRFAVPRMNQRQIRPETFHIAAIGPKTADALKKSGIGIDLEAHRYSAGGLIEVFDGRIRSGVNVFLPVSSLAGDELPDGLDALGARVIRAETYRTVPDTSVDGTWMAGLLDQHGIDCLSFFSPSAFRFFLELTRDDAVGRIRRSGAVIAAIGSPTAGVIREMGLPVPVCPIKSTTEHLMKAIVDYFNRDHGQENNQ